MINLAHNIILMKVGVRWAVLIMIFSCHSYAFQTTSEEKKIHKSLIYIQLDNTARENKNRCVLSFLAFLVEKKIFEGVCRMFNAGIKHWFTIGFQHTYEDVDKFKHEAKEKRCKNSPRYSIKSLSYHFEYIFWTALTTGCKKCNESIDDYNPSKYIFDIKEWLLLQI